MSFCVSSKTAKCNLVMLRRERNYCRSNEWIIIDYNIVKLEMIIGIKI